jgi:hypothetical protein
MPASRADRSGVQSSVQLAATVDVAKKSPGIGVCSFQVIATGSVTTVLNVSGWPEDEVGRGAEFASLVLPLDKTHTRTLALGAFAQAQNSTSTSSCPGTYHRAHTATHDRDRARPRAEPAPRPLRNHRRFTELAHFR